MKKLDLHNTMIFPIILDTQLDFIDVTNVVMKREQTVGMINMKVNYRRTVEKQREAEHQEWLRKRQEKLDVMTPEEREKYLADETQRAKDALKTLGMAQAMLGDSPYSKL